MANWWDDFADAEEDFSDVQSGQSTTNDETERLLALNREFAARGGAPSAGARGMVPSQETPVEDQAALLGSVVPLPGVGPVGSKILPFLQRLGTGLAARSGTGAVSGAAASLPVAVPELLRGDIGGAVEDVATGAGLGAVGGAVPGVGKVLEKLGKVGLSPKGAGAVQSGARAATKVASSAGKPRAELVQQLRQIASRDDASYLAAKQIAKEMGDEGKAIWEQVKTARPRHRAGLSK